MQSPSQLIKIGSGKDKTLSKEQKRFNNYITKLKKLREEIEKLEAFNREVPVRLQRELGPLESEEIRLRKELLFLLDNHPLAPKLTKKQREKLSHIIREEAAVLIRDHGLEELKDVHDRHADVTFEEEQQVLEKSAKEMTANMFKNMFGLDISEEAFESPEKAAEEMMRKLEEQKQRMAEQRQQARKKTPAQLAREQRQAEEEKRIGQTTKSIYMELVKKFHPDQERDEKKRAWKTEVMQQVTAAYKENDFLALLQLQISLLEGKDQSLESLPDDHLKYYNKLLKEQVDEIQQEVYAAHPVYNGSPYGHFYGPPHLLEMKIRQAVSETKITLGQLKHTLTSLDTLSELKDFIKNFELDDNDDDSLAALFGAF
jgi:alpha-glucosidase (family GH31 glycosyl hydrolase)